MQKTRSCVRSVRPGSASRSETGPAPRWPGALRKPTMDDVELQLRHAKQRAEALCAKLQDLDFELHLLDRVSHCAEFGDRATLARLMQSRPGKFVLLQAFD